MRPSVATVIKNSTSEFSVQGWSWPLVKSFMFNVRLTRVADPALLTYLLGRTCVLLWLSLPDRVVSIVPNARHTLLPPTMVAKHASKCSLGHRWEPQVFCEG